MPSVFNRLPVVLLCLLAGCPSTDHSASGSVVVTADDSTLEAFDETTQLHAAVKRITDNLKTEFVTVLDLELPQVLEGDND